MKTVYITSLLLWWLLFLFGKSRAQVVQDFSDGYTNGDIELSPQGNLWGVVRFEESNESGFEEINMQGQTVNYQTFAQRSFRYIAVNAQWVYMSDPEANRIYKYNQTGLCVDSIGGVDNPGNIFADAEGNIYTVETDLNKLVKISPQGTKTILTVDNRLNTNYAITGDTEGNLFTANRYSGQIFRWEKASGQLYLYAQMPIGTSGDDGSQVSEMVYSRGQLYVASVGLCAIYRVNETGEVNLLAGTPGISQYLNAVANKARFVKPVGLAASLSGDTLFVADSGRIRKIVGIADAGLEQTAAQSGALLYPNPATDHVQVRFHTPVAGKMIWKLADADGRILQNGQVTPTGTDTDIRFQPLPRGMYRLVLEHPATGARWTEPIILDNTAY